MANLCFQFSSSFRYVKFQVMHKICQSGHRGQTTKKTRTTKNKAQGLEQQTAVTPGTPTQQVFKISAAAQSAQKGLCLPPEPWGYQEPSGCQTQPGSVCKILPRQKIKPAPSANTPQKKSLTLIEKRSLASMGYFSHTDYIHTRNLGTQEPRNLGTQMAEFEGLQELFTPQQ